MEDLERWNKNRLLKRNICCCDNCSVKSNICAICRNFLQPINFKTTNPPQLTCIRSQCKHSYHIKCLPLTKQKPNSWNTCEEIYKGDQFKCGEEYLDFFTLRHKIQTNTQTTKYEPLIQKKIREYNYNQEVKISDHFGGFIYNKWEFFIQDCCEIVLEKEVGIARIIDIFTDDTKNAWLLIQWYWYKNDFLENIQTDKQELLFANNLDDLYGSSRVIQIQETPEIKKVKVFDTMEEYKHNQEKLSKLKQQKIKEMKIFKQHHQHDSNKLCLRTNVPSYRSITFDKVFWCNKSCNGNVNDKKTYKTHAMDTNKIRMKIQNNIYSQNITEKRPFTNNSKTIQSQQQKTKQDYVNNNNNDNNNQSKTQKIYGMNNNNQNHHHKNKNKKKNKKPIILKLKRKYNFMNDNQSKKRKIHNMNNINCTDNNKNNNNRIISVSFEKYNELKKENDKLKIEFDRGKSTSYEKQILSLQKVNANYKNELNCSETNDRILKSEIMNLYNEKDKLNKHWEMSDMKLNAEHNKMEHCFKDKIKELELKIITLENKLREKNNQIEFYQKVSNEQQIHAQKNENVNSMETNPVIKYHISSIHSPPKQHKIIQKEMYPSEIRGQLFPPII